MARNHKRWLLPSPRRVWHFLRNENVPGWRKGVAYAALGYILFPFDAVPDLAPLAGWLDDMGVASAALLFLSWALGHEPADRSQPPYASDVKPPDPKP